MLRRPPPDDRLARARRGIALAATAPDPGKSGHAGTDSALVCAAVDVGATSVHLLVASVDEAVLEPIADASVFLELGRATRGSPLLGVEVRGRLIETLRAFVDAARSRGAERIAFVGTEPLRRSTDAARVIHDVDRACGVPLHVLSHQEEALLTIVGVMAGRRVDREILVLDVGGGSSEFCLIDGQAPPRIVGLKVGAATLVDAFIRHDPPTADERESMRAAAGEALVGAPLVTSAEIVAVGGTATNLMKLAARSLDGRLTRQGIAEAVDALVSDTTDVVASRHAINPIRARLLPGGAAILDAVMERYGAASIGVSDAGIREGLVLAMARRDWAWRDALPELANGWIA